MQYTKLGNSDLTVSRICMGCMGFGDASNGQHSWTLDVATKFLPRTQEEIAAGVSGQQHIERMINKSLENLGMDYVDLYIYHMWDYQTPLYDIMEGLTNIVKEGKARYIGISNCFAWQLAKANALAEKEGFAKFKYDATKDQDEVIIRRVQELAEKRDVTMTEVSLAWLLTKVTSPVVGATKFHHIEGAAKAVELELTEDEIHYLEKPYVPHALAGVMAQNKPDKAKEKHVLSTAMNGKA